MGTACQVCRQDGANSNFNIYERKFTTLPGGSSMNPSATTIQGLPFDQDAPNPMYVNRITNLPQLIPVVKQILARQTAHKPFFNQMLMELKNKGMIYDGHWKRGLPHGSGQAYYFNGGYFQGYFENGVADSVDGIFIYPDATYYRGRIKDSSANGHGKLVYKNGEMVFTGDWVNDKPHGTGKEEYKDGSLYIGKFVNGIKEGNGTFKWPDGSKYVGSFSEGFMHGEGFQQLPNKEIYRGLFFRNKRQGEGILETPQGIYKGHFAQDKKMGPGEFTFPDGRVFHGVFKDNLPQGYGTMTMPNGQVIKGVWSKGENVEIDNSYRYGSLRPESIINRITDSVHPTVSMPMKGSVVYRT